MQLFVQLQTYQKIEQCPYVLITKNIHIYHGKCNVRIFNILMPILALFFFFCQVLNKCKSWQGITSSTQAKKCTAQGAYSYVYRIEKLIPISGNLLRYCIVLIFPKYTLFRTPSVFTSSKKIAVHKIQKNVSFSSSYNKTHKTY